MRSTGDPLFKKDDNERDKVYTFESVDDSDTGRHGEGGSICVRSKIDCGVENGGTYEAPIALPTLTSFGRHGGTGLD